MRGDINLGCKNMEVCYSKTVPSNYIRVCLSNQQRLIFSSEFPVVFCFLLPSLTQRGQSLKLYVGNLIYNMTEGELSEMFTPYGKVLSAHIITDQYTRQSKNMGYVKMSAREHGKRAIAALNDKFVNKRYLVVREA